MLISSTTPVSPKDNYFIMGKGWPFNACGVDNYTRDMIWLCGLCQHCGVEKLGLVPINYNYVDIGQLVKITLTSIALNLKEQTLKIEHVVLGSLILINRLCLT